MGSRLKGLLLITLPFKRNIWLNVNTAKETQVEKKNLFQLVLHGLCRVYPQLTLE